MFLSKIWNVIAFWCVFFKLLLEALQFEMHFTKCEPRATYKILKTHYNEWCEVSFIQIFTAFTLWTTATSYGRFISIWLESKGTLSAKISGLVSSTFIMDGWPACLSSICVDLDIITIWDGFPSDLFNMNYSKLMKKILKCNGIKQQMSLYFREHMFLTEYFCRSILF